MRIFKKMLALLLFAGLLTALLAGCDAVINGPVTCAEIYAEGYVDRLPTAGRSYERTDRLPPTQAKHTVVCVDTEGSLAWSGPTLKF